MTREQAEALATYCRDACYWLDVQVGADCTVWLSLLWPKGCTPVFQRFSRGDANAAMDRLNDVSEAYWAAAAERESVRKVAKAGWC